MTQCTPCLHLDAASATCELGRVFPHDCMGCSSYHAGQTEHERTRGEAWSAFIRRSLETLGLTPPEQRIERRLRAMEEELARLDKAVQQLVRRLAHIHGEVHAARPQEDDGDTY